MLPRRRPSDSVNMAAGGGALHVGAPGKPSGGFTDVDSSESDGETEPAESFHRRISTNKEIKCSVSTAAAGSERRRRPCCASQGGTRAAQGPASLCSSSPQPVLTTCWPAYRV